MSKIALNGESSGNAIFVIRAPASNTNQEFLLPDSSGTLLTDQDPILSAPIPSDRLPAGSVLQVEYVRYDDRISISAPQNTSGTDITELSVTITPIKADSLIYCQWFIQGEGTDHDIGFRVRVNGAEPSDGYNTDAGNQRWSFITSAQYDGNDNSTPKLETVNYFHEPGSTNLVTYSPSVSSSSSNNRTLRLNRSDGNAGSDNYEVGVSWGVVYEIAQS